MKQSDIDEALVTLYLRLNGYFTSGLIIHSPVHGQATSEVDCLAIRLPHHAQPDRVIGDDPFLNTMSGLTDLLVCEVKSDPGRVAFNGSIKNDTDAIAGMLQWAGLQHPDTVAELANKVQSLLNEELPVDRAQNGLTEGNVRIRALLCCPPMTEVPDNRWRLTAHTILSYAEACFTPEEARPSCSVRYNFQQWSYPLKLVVTWLKDSNRKGPAQLADLYEYLRDGE